MKKYLLVIISAVLLSCNTTTTIYSSLDISFDDYTFQVKRDEDTFEKLQYKWILRVEQSFDIVNYKQDTLCLHMGAKNIFCEYLSQWLKYDDEKSNDEEMDEEMQDFSRHFKLFVDGNDFSRKFTYEDNTLKIKLSHNKKHNICLKYYYIPPDIYGVVFTPFTPPSMYSQAVYDYDLSEGYRQWYFSEDNMKWKNVTFHARNDNEVIISNYKTIRKNTDFVLDFRHSVNDAGLWFTVFDESLYSKNSYKIRNTTFNFYSQKFLDVDSSNTIVNMHTPPDSVIIKDLTTTEAICSNVINFLDDTITRTVNIFKNVYGYGRCSGFVSKNHNYVILLDTSRFDEDYYAQKWHHEFIHCFLSYPSDFDKKICYLFAEGMTVYMDCCLYHRNEDSTEIGKHMARLYNKLSDEMKNTPLFYADRRIPYEVIYFKGAYCIYQFATRIGLEKFNSILKEYYALLNANGDYVTLESFEQCLKSHGVTDQDWNYFIELMS